MAKITGVQLTDELDDIIAGQVQSGAYPSASELVRQAVEQRTRRPNVAHKISNSSLVSE
jgi:putative addiction module CopG family antidote